jgi:hypothetical protein
MAMAPTSDTGLYVAKEAANFDYMGQPVFVSPGTVVRAGHPLMKGHEDLFEPIKVHWDLPKAADEDDEDEKPAARKSPVASARADTQDARTR